MYKDETQRNEQEARGILEYWLAIANESFDKEKINGALDMLEGMILVYNVFASAALELKENKDDYTYELVLI